MRNPYVKKYWASLTSEQRSERGRKAALARHAKLTPEERIAISKKMTAARYKK